MCGRLGQKKCNVVPSLLQRMCALRSKLGIAKLGSFLKAESGGMEMCVQVDRSAGLAILFGECLHSFRGSLQSADSVLVGVGFLWKVFVTSAGDGS